jgi:hypothetical protein
LLVAIGVVLAAVLYVLLTGLTRGPGSTPIGSSFVLGTFSATTTGSGAGAVWYYNATVETAGTGTTWSDLVLQVQLPSGSVDTTGPTSVTTTNSVVSCNVATYTFASATWGTPSSNVCAAGAVGGNGLVSSGDQVELTSSSTLAQQGERFVVFGSGPYSGSASFALP